MGSRKNCGKNGTGFRKGREKGMVVVVAAAVGMLAVLTALFSFSIIEFLLINDDGKVSILIHELELNTVFTCWTNFFF